jgi:sodium-dependent phosphate transporter
VLRRKNSFNLSLMCLPLFTFITVYIGTYYIIQKGPKLADKVSDATNAWISACFGELACSQVVLSQCTMHIGRSVAGARTA